MTLLLVITPFQFIKQCGNHKPLFNVIPFIKAIAQGSPTCIGVRIILLNISKGSTRMLKYIKVRNKNECMTHIAKLYMNMGMLLTLKKIEHNTAHVYCAPGLAL